MENFYLAENPISGSKESIIVHIRQPFTLILASEGVNEDQQNNERLFVFRNNNEREQDWTLSILYTKAAPDQFPDILKSAWRWYGTYLDRKEKQPAFNNGMEV